MKMLLRKRESKRRQSEIENRERERESSYCSRKACFLFFERSNLTLVLFPTEASQFTLPAREALNYKISLDGLNIRALSHVLPIMRD